MRTQIKLLLRKTVNFRSSLSCRSLRSSNRRSSLLFSPQHVIPFVCRYSSNIYTPPVPAALAGTAVGKDESREFMAVFPDIVRDLTEIGKKYPEISDVTKWYAKVLQYNVPGGKKNRGLALIASYRLFMAESELNPEKLRLAQIMGWCIEMLQSFLLVMDDLMDSSEMRRGRPCWYLVNNNGLMAVNDGILLENGIYTILKKYFRNEPYYIHVLETFHDITLKTSMGQSLDMLIAKSFETTRKLDKFTMDCYKAIVKYKTAYYSFHLPIALSMYMAGISDPERHRQAKTILLQMGELFQIQDDYLDCFGELKEIGKVGTDIQDGKCTWLLVLALQRTNVRQRAILEENYGHNNTEKVQAVKNVYKEIGLSSIYSAYEEDTYNLIADRIQQLSSGLPHEVFFKILEKIYKRRS